ncbi:MAG: alpha/beta fold hydrolase [Deltaproteobacteria bacterium]|nr:alpha/beta fold hydrolase [Deltaproteobacteria bacterium]
MSSIARWLLVLGVAACGCGGSGGNDDRPDDGARAIDATPPVASGCVTDVTAGDHEYRCGDRRVDARIPPACLAPGCGLILVLHGDTGDGLLMDAHLKMRDLGEQRGYVVVAPTGPPFGFGRPGSTWSSSEDANLVDIVRQFASVFRVDAKKIHVTGFSRGGFVTWRLLCDHADLFASAAPSGAGFGNNFGEPTCFQQGRAPSRPIPIIFLLGRTDASVGYATMTGIRDAAVASYGATGPSNLAGDAAFVHARWTAGDTVIETLDHAYETVDDGPFASARGHCVPGSTTDPYAAQYAIPCRRPNAFVWGEEVMDFFVAHPMP